MPSASHIQSTLPKDKTADGTMNSDFQAFILFMYKIPLSDLFFNFVPANL
jgi:hypothetical protein